ncbi:hypothetical protein [Dictyobacter arantiisoli]|uniref:Uncharacterized protein n=1 Tax=Dictyobacter arantiisoli TaxID=2014874 RepID=A0A5A5TEX5_9CHLR|nr:hypothetical protein [Dictyobacter arantiisoli]GCF09696.1 hypothetical protein KDI_32600 [Dictyobacter arantiisoli]
MTFRPYHAQQDATKRSSSTSRRKHVDKANLLQDIARHAIVENENIAPLPGNIGIDATGTVSVRGNGNNDHKMAATQYQQCLIRLSTEKAYQRIVEAAQRKIDLFERLYDESRSDAYRWFKHSFRIAIIEAFVITLSIMMPLLVRLFHQEAQLLFVFMGVVTINIINAVITILILRHAIQMNQQVDLYLHSLTDIRSFSNIASFISQLQIDDTHKHLLQKTLVSTSLGISEQSPTRGAEYHQSKPGLENQLAARTTVQ